MPRELHGRLTIDGQRFAIVVSRFNDFITTKLLSGSLDVLLRHGCKDEDVTVAYVPGAFELPFVAKKVAESGSYDAVICLGCIIRGQTPHFEYVAAEAAKGIAHVGLAMRCAIGAQTSVARCVAGAPIASLARCYANAADAVTACAFAG